MRTALHLINGEHFAGAERVQDNLALELPQFGYRVEFVVLKDGAFASERRSSVVVHKMPMSSRFSLGLACKVSELVQQRDVSIIHTHTPRSILIGALASRLCGVPFVHHLHSPTARDTGHVFRDRRNAVVEGIGMAKAQTVFAVAESLKDYAQSQWPRPNRVTVIPNGVAVPNEVQGWVSPVEDQPWVFGFTALIRPRKGLEVALAAFARLRDMGRNVRLLIVGGFESEGYAQEICQLIEKLALGDAVTLTGFQNDLTPFYRRMHALLVPSLYGEGMPMVALEAMAQAVPVIASSIEGLPEVLNGGKAGLLFSAGHHDELVQAMLGIMDQPDLGARIALAGYKRCHAVYSAQSMARAVATQYDRVLTK